MLEFLPAAIPAFPFLAALILGIGQLAGRLAGEPGEAFSGRLVTAAMALAFATAVAAAVCAERGMIPPHIVLGDWLHSGDYRIRVSFSADRLSLWLAVLFALMTWMVARFAINYLHREPGYHRFFMILALFAAAMQWLVLAGNAVFAFIGWEVSGVCSYLLIAYAYDRPAAATNATRAFVTNRIGDAGFAAGIFLAFVLTGSVEWPDITGKATSLTPLVAGFLGLCFLLAAIAKSAQLPFSPWLARAMEGPTPSSAIFYGAVMIHAGVYLVLRLQPVFEQAPLTMDVMTALGAVTALYGFFCGLAQSDVKSALVFSTLGQLGLMFVACGFGFWTLAAWHLGAHAVFRGYQFLIAPSLMHRVLGQPPRPVAAPLARCRQLYLAALRRFWVEEMGDALLVRPVERLAADLNALDRQMIDSAIGLPAPAMEGLSSIADWEEHRLGVLQDRSDRGRHVSGLPGLLVHLIAAAMHWFEDRLVLEGMGGGLAGAGRRLGRGLHRVEGMLTRPRYLVLLVLITLLASI